MCAEANKEGSSSANKVTSPVCQPILWLSRVYGLCFSRMCSVMSITAAGAVCIVSQRLNK